MRRDLAVYPLTALLLLSISSAAARSLTPLYAECKRAIQNAATDQVISEKEADRLADRLHYLEVHDRESRLEYNKTHGGVREWWIKPNPAVESEVQSTIDRLNKLEAVGKKFHNQAVRQLSRGHSSSAESPKPTTRIKE